MDTPLSAPFLLLLLLIISFTQISLCCPVDWFSCKGPEANTPAKHCGSHKIKCKNSTLHVQFHEHGPWYATSNLTYPERRLVVHDPYLGEKLWRTECDFLYNFTSPIPNFYIRQIDPYALFDCKAASYNFSRDFFFGTYGCSNCESYDLYYSCEREELQLPRDQDCTGALHGSSAVVEWTLLFQEVNETAVSFSLMSVGFSHRRRPVANCFGCAMKGGDCSPVGAERSLSCSCHRSCPGKKGLNMNALTIGLGTGASIIALAFIFAIFCLSKYDTKWISNEFSNNNSVETFLKSQETLAVKRYKYSEVKQVTTNFSEKLGQGGYGTVYKGKLLDGTLVAVKLLTDSKGNGEEFINEVSSIGRTNHINVVRLLGCCSEGSKRALIYELMPNGSLDKFLFTDDPKLTTLLGWEKLHEIAVGIARGLEYLHKGCTTRIVHFDIKPHNILLDEDLCAKISDFGLAKFCKPKESIISMVCARGTIGYIAPEVFSKNFGPVSSKSDVYSYGMMILEMVGRRRNVQNQAENTSEVFFPHWIYERLDQCYSLETCADSLEIEIARKMTLVGLWCIQTSPMSRPSITKVVDMLEGNVKDLGIPPKPYICSPEKSRCNTEDIYPTFMTSLS